MHIDTVLKMDGGTVVCVENNATITITGKDEKKTFQPSFPKGTPALDKDRFGELYKHKHFKTAAKSATDKGKD